MYPLNGTIFRPIGQNFPAKVVSLDIFDADIGKASEENSRDMLNIRHAARAI